MQFDLSLSELRAYQPEIDRPDDFDEFWAAQMASVGKVPLDATFEEIPTVLRSTSVFDTQFSGFGGSRINAWLFVPKEIDPDAPTIVEFLGYSGGRGRPVDSLNWSSAGYPHLVMDTRGQGFGWRGSDTADPDSGGEPGAKGFMMRGIESPESHYFTRLYVDAARALAVPTENSVLKSRPVVATGGSQGGALSIAASSLNGEIVAVLPDVPFLSHFRRAVEMTDSHPYFEIAEYCRLHPDRVDDVFATLSYLDVANHAERITAPGLFSVGLVDTITPPSTVFAAYNRYAGAREIEVYPFNGHEGGGSLHFERKVEWLRSLME